MKKRDRIKQKFGGLCAYSGTPLEDDWQMDHLIPVIRNWDGSKLFPQHDTEENLVPCQKIINHYKGSLGVEPFRSWFLGELHLRLAKLPKNPVTEKSVKKKAYLLKVASYFGITTETPFSGTFHFEKSFEV